VDPDRLLFATSLAQARAFPAVLRTVRNLEQGRRAAALYRAQVDRTPAEFTQWIRTWLETNWKS
jgi:hypothetical protein